MTRSLSNTRSSIVLRVVGDSFNAYRAKEVVPLHRYNDVTIRQGRRRNDGKRPLDKDWSRKRYDAGQVISRCIRENRNMGHRLTAEEVVIDVDPRHGGDRSIQQLQQDFPNLQLHKHPHVETGGGGSHYHGCKPAYVEIVGALKCYPGLEFKSKGSQVVAAGSIHPETKKHYDLDWLDYVPFDQAPKWPTELIDAITRPQHEPASESVECTPEQVAEMLASLNVRSFRDELKWRQLMMSCHHASGGAAREEFIRWSTTDPEYANHAAEIGSRWDSLSLKSTNALTFGTLRKFVLDEGDATTLPPNEVEPGEFDEVIGDDVSKYGLVDSRRYDENKLPEILDYAEAAMLRGGVPLYQTGGRIVHPFRLEKDSEDEQQIRRRAGALLIRDISPLRLREYMIEHTSFYKLVQGRRVECAAPTILARHYLAREDKWRSPLLTGVIETPTLRRDGTLLVANGFDSASGLLLDTAGIQYPEIIDKPSREDAYDALQTLLWPFKEFPFVKDVKGKSASSSVMLSAVLTALVRRTLRSAPLHGTSAPTMGTGKTLLWDIVSIIATGRSVTAMSQGASEEEDEKRLFSALLTGDLLVMIDNVHRPIEGDALCTILTQETWQSRILGENRKVTVPTNVLFGATGNNLTFKGDMATRALVCRIDAGLEHPETRRFDVDLKIEVPKRRTELVAAGLTLLRAFVVAGRPGLKKLVPFGRFEDWSNLVRGAIVWLGEPDPCQTREFINLDDPERMALQGLLDAIHHNTDAWFTAGDLLKQAEINALEDGALWEAIVGAVPKANSQALGYYLKAKDGRIVGGLRLQSRSDAHRKVRVYRVTMVE